MKLFDTLKADGKSIGASIEGIFSTLEGKLVSFLSEGADAIAAAIKDQAPTVEGDIVTFIEMNALAAVAAAEATPGGGQAKMAAALTTFGAALAVKGLKLAETEMRTLLENALLIFKAKAAPAATSSAAS